MPLIRELRRTMHLTVVMTTHDRDAHEDAARIGRIGQLFDAILTTAMGLASMSVVLVIAAGA